MMKQTHRPVLINKCLDESVFVRLRPDVITHSNASTLNQHPSIHYLTFDGRDLDKYSQSYQVRFPCFLSNPSIIR